VLKSKFELPQNERKNMKKRRIYRALAAILVVVTVLSLVACAQNEEFVFEIDENGEAVLVGYHGKGGNVTVPKEWIGMTVGQLDIRRKYKINIMGIKKNGKFSVSITPDMVLTEDKTLMVVGEYKALQKCFRI
jgi:hypothetical protein